jgi:dihydropteroate synthase
MHMQGEPKTMQQQPEYTDVIQQVLGFFVERIAACEAAGLARENIFLDPGFGFGKTVEHNFQMLKKLELFHSLGCPLLVGISRKSMLGAVTGKPVEQRLAGSLAAVVVAALQGAQVLRVHDVAETIDALKVVQATQMEER